MARMVSARNRPASTEEAAILHPQPGLQGTLEPDLEEERAEKKFTVEIPSPLSQYSPCFLSSSPFYPFTLT